MLDAGCFGLLAVWAPRLCDMVVAEAGEAEGVWQTEVAVAKVVVAVMSVAVKAAPVAAVAAVGRWCCDSDASVVVVLIVMVVRLRGTKRSVGTCAPGVVELSPQGV